MTAPGGPPSRPHEERANAVFRIGHVAQPYAWGSQQAIHEVLGLPPGDLVAEAWFGAHAVAPSPVLDRPGTSLDALLAAEPTTMVGADVTARFGDGLPYLLKLIAAERPLSLQVHPHVARAVEGYAEEEAAGIPVDAPHRSFRDRNHKPELVFALTRFEAVSGFRAPRRAAELLAELDAPLAARLHAHLVESPSPEGIRRAFTTLLDPATRPTADEVAAVADACAARLEVGSPSPRADRVVSRLAQAYPGDPGVVVSLLLNPVTLQPGEAMFVPAGGVHAYLSGLGIEVMASSDNVLRAGLTPKHIDVPELLRNVDYVAAPPIRIAPETFHGSTKVYYAPVDDFELSVTDVDDDTTHPLPGRGPRILLCLEGSMEIVPESGEPLVLERGEAAFVPPVDGRLRVTGRGRIVQADVP